MKIIAGNSNLPLAHKISECLNISLTQANIRRFNDKEVFIEILDNMRGQDVFIIQPTCFPANDNIMELLICIDALKRSSARRITAVLPYYGYARQDRKPGPRTPISAKLVANLITVAGADRVLTMDLHAGQIQGFFDIPLDNLYAQPVLVSDIEKHFDIKNVTIVSPDVGGVARARSYAGRIGVDLAIIDKRRQKANQSEVMNIIGDVVNKDCIIVDDIVDTAGTLCNAANALMDKGARSVTAYITHGVLSGNAIKKIHNSALSELVVTDSIHLSEQAEQEKKVRVVTISNLIAEAMHRISEEGSISSLFD